MAGTTYNSNAFLAWLPEGVAAFLWRWNYQRRVNSRNLATVQVWSRH